MSYRVNPLVIYEVASGLYTLWNLEFHAWYEVETYTRGSLTEDADWEIQHFGRVTHVNFKHKKTFFRLQQRLKNCVINKSPLSRGLTGEGFKYEASSRTQDMVWSLFFPIESLSVSSNRPRYGPFAHDQI